MAEMDWIDLSKPLRKAPPKLPFTSKQCFHCGEKVPVPDIEPWKALKNIPWCEKDFPELYAVLSPQFTPQDLVDAFLKVRPGNLARADGLEVELGLKPPCPCNNCRGGA